MCIATVHTNAIVLRSVGRDSSVPAERNEEDQDVRYRRRNLQTRSHRADKYNGWARLQLEPAVATNAELVGQGQDAPSRDSRDRRRTRRGGVHLHGDASGRASTPNLRGDAPSFWPTSTKGSEVIAACRCVGIRQGSCSV